MIQVYEKVEIRAPITLPSQEDHVDELCFNKSLIFQTIVNIHHGMVSLKPAVLTVRATPGRPPCTIHHTLLLNHNPPHTSPPH